MSTANDTLHVVVRGDSAKLTAIDALHLADLISAVAHIAGAVFGLREEQESGLHLVGFRENSVELVFKPAGKQTCKRCVEAIKRTLDWTAPGEPATAEITDFVRELIVFSKRYGVTLSITATGEVETTATITGSTPSPGTVELRSESLLLGTVQSVGGEETPSARIRTPDGRVVLVETSAELAKELANRLYEFVALQGVKVYDPVGKNVVLFECRHILSYEPESTETILERVREEFGHYYADIKNVEEYVRKLRRGKV